MLGRDEFEKLYWAQYVSIEKEFSKTISYLTLSEENYQAYSIAYLKLLLEIGSEVDILFKLLCEMIDKDFKGQKITEYIQCINENKPIFVEQKVVTIDGDISLVTWEQQSPEKQSPFWWNIYNKVKHERYYTGSIEGVEKPYIKFANQGSVLNAIAGLYQIEIYAYYQIAVCDQDRVKVPLPGSRLFRLTGDIWDGIQFYGDMAFYIDGGHLIYKNNPFICF